MYTCTHKYMHASVGKGIQLHKEAQAILQTSNKCIEGHLLQRTIREFRTIKDRSSGGVFCCCKRTSNDRPLISRHPLNNL